ncbi:HAD family hydrolase [Aurantibacter sp.]|uniref:HAD family hydrolase n=1 Tax=Aurantibacter sp. TaxID=2807103 RepID=UPI00326704A0
MDLSKVKLVVTDMDGTLLNSNHEVSDRFFELYKDLKKKDILFIAASGRQYNSIVDKLSSIKNEIIVIAENGGFAMKNNSEILSTPMSNAAKNKILEVLETVPNVHPVLCSKTNAYLTNSSPEFVNKLKEYYTEFTILEDLKQHEGEIIKIAIYHFESSEKHIYPSVKHLEGDLKVKVSGENWVDISSPNANKGFALNIIQNQYNITPAETMVFGDFNNDLEMLALADFSFAMKNAHPNVKKAANYETLSNDENGVEHILELLVK